MHHLWLLSVVHLLELKVELKNPFVKAASESTFSFGAVIPFLVDDTESKVFIWRSTDEANETCVLFSSRCE